MARDFNWKPITPSVSQSSAESANSARFLDTINRSAQLIRDAGQSIYDRQSDLLTNAAIAEAMSTGKKPEILDKRVDQEAMAGALFKHAQARRQTADAERLEYENQPWYRDMERKFEERRLNQADANIEATNARTAIMENQLAEQIRQGNIEQARYDELMKSKDVFNAAMDEHESMFEDRYNSYERVAQNEKAKAMLADAKKHLQFAQAQEAFDNNNPIAAIGMLKEALRLGCRAVQVPSDAFFRQPD